MSSHSRLRRVLRYVDNIITNNINLFKILFHLFSSCYISDVSLSDIHSTSAETASMALPAENNESNLFGSTFPGISPLLLNSSSSPVS